VGGRTWRALWLGLVDPVAVGGRAGRAGSVCRRGGARLLHGPHQVCLGRVRFSVSAQL
jgi:hypothetical protein